MLIARRMPTATLVVQYQAPAAPSIPRTVGGSRIPDIADQPRREVQAVLQERIAGDHSRQTMRAWRGPARRCFRHFTRKVSRRHGGECLTRIFVKQGVAGFWKRTAIFLCRLDHVQHRIDEPGFKVGHQSPRGAQQ